jgi:hypothetical protein
MGPRALTPSLPRSRPLGVQHERAVFTTPCSQTPCSHVTEEFSIKLRREHDSAEDAILRRWNERRCGDA